MLKPIFTYPLLLDVDDVLLDLLTTWLEVYNEDYRDELTKFDCRSWAVHEYPDLYYAVQPIQGAVDGVNWLRKNNIPFVFLTSFDPAGSKFRCLKEHGFTDDHEEYIVSYRKDLIRGSMMIDDRPKNVEEFGHRAWLFSQPHNEYFEWKERVDSWPEIISKMSETFKIGVE
jgi:5'(3')-deoxyribonucleotidase